MPLPREDLKDAETEDLINELETRGELPETDVNDFTNEQLLQALGYEPDDSIDHNHFYQLFVLGRADEAMSEFKKLIEQRTGRIIV